MTLYRVILRSLRRSSPLSPTTNSIPTITASNDSILHRNHQQLNHNLISARAFAFSSAEEAAAERRRRKRRLRIEPPLHALRRDPSAPRPRPDPNAPRLPDSTSALVGPRLNLHNTVQGLIRAGDLDGASATARHAVFSNTRPTVFTCNAIMASMYRAGRYDDAIALFTFFFKQSNIVPNVVSYNVLINTHCDAGRVDTGIEIYHHILANAPFSPSPVTYRHLTKGLVDAGRISDAMDLLREMLNKGHGADSLVYNVLISGFLNLGNLERANELLDELRERCLVYDGVIHATFMDWYWNQGKDAEAMESYRNLLDRQFKMSPATCNTLLEVLLKYEKGVEASALFRQMLDNHTPPTLQAVNSDTFNIMVNECFRLGNFSEAIEVFKKVGTQPKSKPYAMDAAGYNNIMSRFCEHGLVSEAEKLFAEMSTKSVMLDNNTYRIFIDTYLKEERMDDVVYFFNKMVVESGLRYNGVYCNKVFDELVKKGKVEEAAEILGKMGERREVKPAPTHYESVITALCKEGKLDKSRDLLSQMMRNGIVGPPTLSDFISETFSKEGRKDEIDKIFEMRLGPVGGNMPYSSAPRTGTDQFGMPRISSPTRTVAGLPPSSPVPQNVADMPPSSPVPTMAGQVATGFRV
ncbi:pentatricopeptide repeat-containing protein At1g10270-like [Macadamia integrifolia]|uniref:pentatricopeptide repeat-containing protein At1g10270-like n=1 Tax=Macadamia integrifolia TaxID=60698 RepID=UPI001C4EB651|nr:pentatricopeptide repeat-containing protein At1g10270-like [Macadamia integrifolia]